MRRRLFRYIENPPVNYKFTSKRDLSSWVVFYGFKNYYGMLLKLELIMVVLFNLLDLQERSVAYVDMRLFNLWFIYVIHLCL